MIDFTNIQTSDLVRIYNECAAKFDKPSVTRFADRKTAESRTRFILSQLRPSIRPEPFREDEEAPKPKAKTHHPDIVGVTFTQAPTSPPDIVVAAPEPVVTVSKSNPPSTDARASKSNPKEPTAAPTFNGLSFGAVHAGTFREKLIEALAARRNEMVPIDDLLAATYGSPDASKTIAIGRVLDGVAMMIEAAKTPVELRRTKKGSGLFDVA